MIQACATERPQLQAKDNTAKVQEHRKRGRLKKSGHWICLKEYMKTLHLKKTDVTDKNRWEGNTHGSLMSGPKTLKKRGHSQQP